MEKVSLVVTVLNEQGSIESLLKSITQLSRKPDELICVDGGSTDRTIGVIGAYGQSHSQFPIRILRHPGNIATGRNAGIHAAKYNVIAVTDAGCTVEKKWLAHLIAPFKDKTVDVVAGYYTPTGTSFLQKCMGVYTSVMPDTLDPENFLPSSRSIAFRKKAWEKVGGYPEELDTAEDLVFAQAMKDADVKFHTAADALVLWPQRATWKEAFLQFFRYAQGDGRALYFRPHTPILILRCLTAIILIGYASRFPNPGMYYLGVYMVIYYLFSVLKNWRYVPEWRALLYLPALQCLSDCAVTSGMLVGFMKRYV